MVNKICDIKNKFVEHIDKVIGERGIDRINVSEMGDLVDIVKDLAEAEKECWEAQYYRNIVTEAMEAKYGYQPHMMDERMGYAQLSRGTGTMGYGDDIVEQLSERMKHATPEERMTMRSRIIGKLNER